MKSMKRSIALILAVVLALSICPISVLAEDPASSYSCTDSDIHDEMGVFFFQERDEEAKTLRYDENLLQWSDEDLVITCSNASSKTIYMACVDSFVVTPEGSDTNALTSIGTWTRTFTPDGKTEPETESLPLYSLTVTKPAKGFEAKYSATHTWDEGASSESFTLVFDFIPIYSCADDSLVNRKGIFFFKNLNETNKTLSSCDNDMVQENCEGDNVEFVIGCEGADSQTIYMASLDTLSVTGDSFEEIGKWEKTFIPDDKTEPETEYLSLYKITASKPTDSLTAEYTLTCGDDSFGLKFEFVVPNEDNQVQADGKLTSEAGLSYDLVPVGTTGLYIAPVYAQESGLVKMGESRGPLPQFGRQEDFFAAGVWKKIEGSETFELLTDDELRAVKDRFDLEMQLLLLDEGVETEFPQVTPLPDDLLPCAGLYSFSRYNQGTWIVKVTGTYNDGHRTIPITAYAKTIRHFTESDGLNFIEEQDLTAADVNEALQRYLAQHAAEYQGKDVVLDIQLPAGTVEGYIEIPSSLYMVNIWGVTDNATGDLLTTLKGGIHANNTLCSASNLRFVGAGRTQKTVNYKGVEHPNSAIYGIAGGSVNYCSLTGYNYAIYQQGGTIGSQPRFDGGNEYYTDTGSFFYNNEVGIMVDMIKGTDLWGQPWIKNTVMVNNGNDIYLKDTHNSPYGVDFEFSNCIFVRSDNTNGIRNNLGITYYLPLQTFAGSHYNCKAPKVDGNVSVAPYYNLTSAGRLALIDNLNVEDMLKHPSFDANWIASNERVFPKNWKCPVKGNGDLYYVPANQVDSEGMTIEMMGNGNDQCATIQLKQEQ